MNSAISRRARGTQRAWDFFNLLTSQAPSVALNSRFNFIARNYRVGFTNERAHIIRDARAIRYRWSFRERRSGPIPAPASVPACSTRSDRVSNLRLDELLPDDHQARAIGNYVKRPTSPHFDRIKAVEGNSGRDPVDPRILMAFGCTPRSRESAVRVNWIDSANAMSFIDGSVAVCP